MTKKLAAIALSGILSQAAFASNDHYKTYQVTITNAHSFHVLTPPVIIAHSRDFHLFEIAMPASEGLAHQAENGDPSVLLAELDDNDYVKNKVVGDFVHPGESKTFEIQAHRYVHFSVSSMLAGTNDAFIAVRGIAAPKRAVYANAMVYDAGSEHNTESCADIPGPPCAKRSGNARVPEGAEGFVTFSNGVHGVADLEPSLVPSQSDWRGPVAIVKIERMRH